MVRRDSEEVDPKTWSTLVARAALKGYQLWRTDADDGVQRFVVGRWGMVRILADVDEVQRFLTQVGVPA